MLALLDDIRTAPDRNRGSHLAVRTAGLDSPSAGKKEWRFFEKTPYSPGGPKPFFGGARLPCNEGVHYNKLATGGSTMKATRVMDRLPRNLQVGETQS